MSKVVGVVVDGDVSWHAPGVFQDYSTLCGIDADDPTIGHGGIVPSCSGQKINCVACFSIWKNTIDLKLRPQNFRAEK